MSAGETAKTNQPGRRERKKIATKEAIAHAALTLATERPFCHTTVEMIAEKADVSYRTFFNYFATKEEAVLWVAPSAEQEFTDFILSRPDDEAVIETVTALLRDRIEGLYELRETLVLRGKAAANDPSLRSAMSAQVHQVDSAIADAFATRLGVEDSADPSPFIISKVTASSLELAARNIARGKSVKEVHAIVESALDLVRSGLDVAR